MGAWEFAGDIGGGVVGGLGSYLSAREANKGAQEMVNMNERAAAWTQLLGLQELQGAAPGVEDAIARYMKLMGDATATTNKAPGAVAAGTARARAALAGVETSGINSIMKNQQLGFGDIAQNAASGGFYGSSVQGGNNHMVRDSANLSVGQLLSSIGSVRAGVEQQGSAQMLNALITKASGKQAGAAAELTGGLQKYGLSQDKLNWLLSTANQFGTDTNTILKGQSENPFFGGMTTGPLAKFGPGGDGGGPSLGDQLDFTGFYGGVGDLWQSGWDNTIGKLF